MHSVFASGFAPTVLGLFGYAVGVAASYPGRAFSLTGLMVGLTLAAVGRSLDAEAVG